MTTDIEDYILEHERLDVYQCVVEFIDVAAPIAASPPRGYGDLGRQLREAFSSMPLNIAEGYNDESEAQKSRFYNYARGSALECAAVFDVLVRVDGIEQPDFRRGKQLLGRAVSMLTRMRENPI